MDAARLAPHQAGCKARPWPLEGEAAFLSRQACGPLLLGCYGLIGGWG